MRYGIDLDNCLADFTTHHIQVIKELTGKQLPPRSNTYPAVWAYHKPTLTPAEDSKVWEFIKTSNFWLDIPPMPKGELALELLSAKRFAGDAIYFITSRPGLKAKLLSEYWLYNHGFGGATVLIVDSDSAKGLLARALKLDVFIDDKPGNVEAVARQADPSCKIYLVDAPYNRTFNEKDHLIIRIPSAYDAIVEQEPLRVAA